MSFASAAYNGNYSVTM